MPKNPDKTPAVRPMAIKMIMLVGVIMISFPFYSHIVTRFPLHIDPMDLPVSAKQDAQSLCDVPTETVGTKKSVTINASRLLHSSFSTSYCENQFFPIGSQFEIFEPDDFSLFGRTASSQRSSGDCWNESEPTAPSEKFILALNNVPRPVLRDDLVVIGCGRSESIDLEGMFQDVCSDIDAV